VRRHEPGASSVVTEVPMRDQRQPNVGSHRPGDCGVKTVECVWKLPEYSWQQRTIVGG
jgi:hypothetical protein